MNIEDLRDYCISKPGVTEEIPFSKLPDVLVFKVSGKMFLATDISDYDGISLKGNPDEIPELRALYEGVNKPSYMSQKHWIHVSVDGTVPENLIRKWIDVSYRLVVNKLTKKEQANLGF